MTQNFDGLKYWQIFSNLSIFHSTTCYSHVINIYQVCTRNKANFIAGWCTQYQMTISGLEMFFSHYDMHIYN